MGTTSPKSGGDEARARDRPRATSPSRQSQSMASSSSPSPRSGAPPQSNSPISPTSTAASRLPRAGSAAMAPSSSRLPPPSSPSSTSPSPFRPRALPSASASSSQYAFPLPTPSPPPAPPLARSSVSSITRSRRPSPLLHEIQPPSRRLSAHQMLLLTPFGSALPPLGMARGSSSMGSSTSAAQPQTAPMRMSGGSRSPFWPRRESEGGGAGRGGAVGMGISPSSIGIGTSPSDRAAGASAGMEGAGGKGPPPSASWTRPRHHSFKLAAAPSPLAVSAPMSTIQSTSEHGSSDEAKTISRPSSGDNDTRDEAVDDGAVEEEREGMELLALGPAPGTVPMTRSNSLPVLTLRELQALKEKDGELGIARGGQWAWVSREGGTDEEDSEDEAGDEPTPLMTEDHTTASTSCTSLSSTTSSQPPAPPSPANLPFTAFNDPFAPRSAQAGMVREVSLASGHSIPPHHFIPVATSPGYHYAPTMHDSRRASETPSTGSGHSPGRRPSVPWLMHSTARPSATAPRAFPSSSSTASSSTPPTSHYPTFPASQQQQHPEPPAAARPRLTRYRSSPGPSQGLGLQITVRPNPTASSSPRTSVEYERRRSGRASGGWAAVDVLDALSASAEFDAAPVPSSAASSGSIASVTLSQRHRPLGSTGSSSGSTGSAGRQTSASSTMLLVARSGLSSSFAAAFSPPHFQRGRFESVDSALPLLASGGGAAVVPDKEDKEQARWIGTFPRRGSLGIGALKGSALGVWAKDRFGGGGGLIGGTSRGGAGGGAGGLEVSIGGVGAGRAASGHWSERRGSWAEGWGKD